jgi:hypothetical protein
MPVSEIIQPDTGIFIMNEKQRQDLATALAKNLAL